MRILCIGAHPDDCEIGFAGTAARFAALGHTVKFVSVTDGGAGHHELQPATLTQVRKAEAAESALRLGIAEYEVLSHPDGSLQPGPEVRDDLIRQIRTWQADLVFTHRPWDYHPDHRYTSQAVQDSAYLVMVPHVCADTAPLSRNPIFLYMEDAFRRPLPFAADVAVDVEPVWDLKVAAMDAHVSQFYEWLPWVGGFSEDVPAGHEERREWLSEQYTRRPSECTRRVLAMRYGSEAAGRIRHAEAFEVCEYGRQPAGEELDAIFPF